MPRTHRGACRRGGADPAATAERLGVKGSPRSCGPDAKTDAYFDPAGQDLLARLLLAAALDHRPIAQVHAWLTRPADDTAVDILRTHGYAETANAVGGVVNAPEKQCGGAYGTALQMASCLTNRQIARPTRPRRQPAAVRPGRLRPLQRDLYSLSKEGKGTTGPLVTALGAPMVGVLDEAANVCRWNRRGGTWAASRCV